MPNPISPREKTSALVWNAIAAKEKGSTTPGSIIDWSNLVLFEVEIAALIASETTNITVINLSIEEAPIPYSASPVTVA